jgi:hypothetical protein
MLDQHHCDVVALLCVRDADDRLGPVFSKKRLVVEHPVTDIFVAFFDQ